MSHDIGSLSISLIDWNTTTQIERFFNSLIELKWLVPEQGVFSVWELGSNDYGDNTREWVSTAEFQDLLFEKLHRKERVAFDTYFPETVDFASFLLSSETLLVMLNAGARRSKYGLLVDINFYYQHVSKLAFTAFGPTTVEFSAYIDRL